MKPQCALAVLGAKDYRCSYFVKASFSPDDRFIISGSSDNNVYMWDWLSDSGKSSTGPWILKGHEGEVTCVTWSRGDLGLVCDKIIFFLFFGLQVTRLLLAPMIQPFDFGDSTAR